MDLLELLCVILMIPSLSGNGNVDNNSGTTINVSNGNNTQILNNMLAREILKRQELEKRVEVLEATVQGMVNDILGNKNSFGVLKTDVQMLLTRQKNMATSIQKITAHVDSEEKTLKQRLNHLTSDVNKSIQTQQNTNVAVAFKSKLLTDCRIRLGAIPFDNTDFNKGGDLTRSGIFQATVTGIYSFQVNIESGNFDGYFSQNGNPTSYITSKSQSNDYVTSSSVILLLNAGDRVWIQKTDNSDSIVKSRKSVFSGYLVYTT